MDLLNTSDLDAGFGPRESPDPFPLSFLFVFAAGDRSSLAQRNRPDLFQRN